MPWHELLGPLHRLPQPVALDGWFAVLQAHCTGGTFELAMLGGRLAATPGLAFLSGYQTALQRLGWVSCSRCAALVVVRRRSG